MIPARVPGINQEQSDPIIRLDDLRALQAGLASRAVRHAALRGPRPSGFAYGKVALRSRFGLRWIKQHLRIKRFLGTSENTVKTQIWCAIATYVLIAIVKKELHLDASLYTLLQIYSVSVFEKIELRRAFAKEACMITTDPLSISLPLFDT